MRSSRNAAGSSPVGGTNLKDLLNEKKSFYWEDDGTLDFSPPLSGYGNNNFKTWMSEKKYNELPEIDDDGLVEEYEEAFGKLTEVVKKIRERAY